MLKTLIPCPNCDKETTSEVRSTTICFAHNLLTFTVRCLEDGCGSVRIVKYDIKQRSTSQFNANEISHIQNNS